VIEWLGGPAEYHFRKVRPAGDFDWASLDARDYPPALLAAARDVWMGVVVSEYAAIASFADVVSALALARAPLDLIGMTSDFLADEVRHVELASRLVMQLGGAPARNVDVNRLSPRTPTSRTPFERANELALRIGCIAEVFASETSAAMMKETVHPLVRSVYESILRDEARHRRFGSLYFEWAADRLELAERERLGFAALDALRGYAALWRQAAHGDATAAAWGEYTAHQFGWFEPARYVPLAKAAVHDAIIPSLREIGLVLPEAEVEALFGD
jgi:hypothetical protein